MYAIEADRDGGPKGIHLVGESDEHEWLRACAAPAIFGAVANHVLGPVPAHDLLLAIKVSHMTLFSDERFDRMFSVFFDDAYRQNIEAYAEGQVAGAAYGNQARVTAEAELLSEPLISERLPIDIWLNHAGFEVTLVDGELVPATDNFRFEDHTGLDITQEQLAHARTLGVTHVASRFAIEHAGERDSPPHVSGEAQATLGRMENGLFVPAMDTRFLLQA